MCNNEALSRELRDTRKALTETNAELVATRIKVAEVAQDLNTWKGTKCAAHEVALLDLKKAQDGTKEVADRAATRAIILGGVLFLLLQIAAGFVVTVL